MADVGTQIPQPAVLAAFVQEMLAGFVDRGLITADERRQWLGRWNDALDEARGRMRIPPHDHDWRVDPFVILPTNPPQRKLVCATCGATKGSGFERLNARVKPGAPETWPRWVDA